ncbi:MAG: hypothetical protein ACYS72_02750 [Planctomycetota bacterium]|jgi:hypothetical protein
MMWNIFENGWLLLTLAGVSLVVASIVRQEKPEWGYKPLLVPLLLAVLAFGMDYAFTTDFEAVSAIVPACKQAAIDGNPDRIMELISPNYRDKYHNDRTDLHSRVRHTITGASIKKIRTQSHTVTVEGAKARSELIVAVHMNNDSRYAAYGTFFMVEINFDYEKIDEEWYILQMDIKTVNYQPMKWSEIP